jgi:hypothetical protein
MRHNESPCDGSTFQILSSSQAQRKIPCPSTSLSIPRSLYDAHSPAPHILPWPSANSSRSYSEAHHGPPRCPAPPRAPRPLPPSELTHGRRKMVRTTRWSAPVTTGALSLEASTHEPEALYRRSAPVTAGTCVCHQRTLTVGPSLKRIVRCSRHWSDGRRS